MPPDLNDALLLAVQAHRGQMDKAGKPYILHPIRVMMRMESDLDRTVAILHDVVEDTDITLESLRRQGYPQEAIEAIERLTRRDGESYDAYLSRVETNEIARRVKMADLEDNMDWRRLAGRTEQDQRRMERYRRALERLTKGIPTG